MTLQQSTISPGAPRKASMDFLRLREEAMEVVRALAGGTWTDHNLHDPGITILEQLCYALTDLGYRLNFSVPELLADALQGNTIGWKPGLSPDEIASLPGMPTAHEVLHAAPTTMLDWRARLLDIDGVRTIDLAQAQNVIPNVYFHDKQTTIVVRDNPQPEHVPMSLLGLQTIKVHAEQGRYRQVSQQVHATYHANRPAGEDITPLVQLVPAPISLIGEIALARGTDPVETLAQIFLRIDQYLTPFMQYHSAEELTARGVNADEFLDSPRLSGGLVDMQQVAQLAPRRTIHLSKLIETVFEVDGVAEVLNLHLKAERSQINYDDGVQYWVPSVSEGMVPTLDPETAGLQVRIEGAVQFVDADRVQQRFRSLRDQLKGGSNVQQGRVLPRNRKVAAYQSIQHQFPDNYGINGRGLPAGADNQRRVLAHQLKTWLIFFEQILADYFSKAGGLGQYFQFQQLSDGQFPDGILDDVPGVESVFLPVRNQAVALADSEVMAQLQRFERLMSHMLARFGQEMSHFSDYVVRGLPEPARLRARLDKMVSYFHNLPQVTERRGQGVNVTLPSIDAQSPGGLLQRLAALLGFAPNVPGPRPQGISAADAFASVNMLLIEHILLRPLPQDLDHENLIYRFRSGKITRIVRLRSKAIPYTYRFKCYATGTAALRQQSISDDELGVKPHDRVEIVFTVGERKDDYDVVAADGESFTIKVDELLANGNGNPQGGIWNLLDSSESKLHIDPWSLQVTYVLPAHAASFSEPQQQKLATQILRVETPAHLACNILWLDNLRWLELCEHYAAWRVRMEEFTRDQLHGTMGNKRYIALRHLRNVLLRALYPGETEPLRDIPTNLSLPQGLMLDSEEEGTRHIHAAANANIAFSWVLEEPEEGIAYHVVNLNAPIEAKIPFDTFVFNTTEVDGQIHLEVELSQFGAGTHLLGIFARDNNIDSGSLLLAQTTLTLS